MLQSYITHGPECWAYGTPGVGRVPLDLYWSEERTDVWSLSSNASKRQAEREGYTRVRTTAWLPESC